MPNNITELVNGFFTSCAKDGRQPNEENLRAWLWFICPANLREEVGPAIRADNRWSPAMTRARKIRLSHEEDSRLAANAAEAGLSVSAFIRERCCR